MKPLGTHGRCCCGGIGRRCKYFGTNARRPWNGVLFGPRCRVLKYKIVRDGTTDALGGTAFYGLNSNPKYHPHVRKCPTYRQEDAWLNRANRKRDGAYCARGVPLVNLC